METAKAAAESAARPTVCVTGATGYIASWLVRSLIRRGYRIHATVRDAGKAEWLVQKLAGETSSRLKIFEADLNKEGSFDDAVKSCQFVLHVAASMEFDIFSQQEDDIEEQVRARILQPAVRGAVNVLQACASSGSVKRVVFTSSISTISGRDDGGRRRYMVDESSVLSPDLVWKKKPRGWVYILSKLMTEEKAFEFAREKGIDLVSVIPPTVAGPFLTPGVPASVRVLLSPITGDPQLYPILLSVNSRLGSTPLVHIEDICSAHIFLMEEPGARGRYICSAASSSLPQLARLLSAEYPDFSGNWRLDEELSSGDASAVISSKRLTELGFKFEYGVGDIIKQSVDCCVEFGFLKCFVN